MWMGPFCTHLSACIRVLPFEMTRGKISTVIWSERCPTAYTKPLNYHATPELFLESWRWYHQKKEEHTKFKFSNCFVAFCFVLNEYITKNGWLQIFGIRLCTTFSIIININTCPFTEFHKYVYKYFRSKPLFRPVPAVPLRLFLRFILSAQKI